MRALTAACLFVGFAGSAMAQSNPYDHYVSGYTTSRGTYVEPHYQTDPNNSRFDNYETRGNYNPHTDEYGTRDPY